VNAVVKEISLSGRIICISDIHGHLDLFQKLLDKVGYTSEDSLILLGDLYTKGPRPLDTLRFLTGLSRSPNVHILRGNCDWVLDAMSPEETAWLEALPHILDAGGYLFVHGGLPSEDLNGLDAWACMKNDAFMEQGLSFSRRVVTGHWPVFNYCRKIPCTNPIIDSERRIVAIDGGCVVNYCGQLNAFIIEDGVFSFDSADDFPDRRIDKAQEESGGSINITWTDREVEMIRHGAEFALVRHKSSGIELEIPESYLFTDWEGRLCGSRMGTDYFLPVGTGEIVKLIDEFSDRICAKKNGYVGWIMK
jgi:predicted phosphodiesterase